MTVPIRREKARLVTEPITDDNREAALSGGDLTEEEHEVTLSEEVIDVDKHVEAKERVRLETDVETEEVAVDEQVRKERIEFEGDPDRSEPASPHQRHRPRPRRRAHPQPALRRRWLHYRATVRQPLGGGADAPPTRTVRPHGLPPN